jgi:NADPH-dependent ferric siderophore reductase
LAQPLPKKPRVPRRIEVVSVERQAPRWVSVLLHGDELEGFHVDAPTGHVKLFFPAEGETAAPAPAVVDGRVVFPDAAVQPAVRTYTPRRFDAAARTLEVQFLIHGDGPGSRWAERAAVGHRLVLIGPGGRFVLEPEVERWWIAGDESALPAIGTLLEAIPASAKAEVHVEVASDDDRLEIPMAAEARVVWHRRRSPADYGAELLDAARLAEASPDSRYWVACEAGAMRAIRRLLLDERNLPKTSVITRGYWRAGETNYPDHDYGED